MLRFKLIKLAAIAVLYSSPGLCFAAGGGAFIGAILGAILGVCMMNQSLNSVKSGTPSNPIRI